MDNSDEEAVGYKKPPKKTRFSSKYQPNRNPAKQVDADCTLDMRETLRDILMQVCKIPRNGRNTRISIAAVLGEKFVKAGLNGDIDDMAKVMKILKEFGVFEDAGKLKYLQREWEAERETLDATIVKLSDAVAGLLQFFREINSECIWLAEKYMEANSKCNCEAFSDDVELIQAIRQLADGAREAIALDPQDGPEMGHWGGFQSDPALNTSRRSQRGGNGRSDSEPCLEDELKNEFYTGMLGADDPIPPAGDDDGED
ncbi:hypothetical protein [Novosphingobium sp. Gsoil 351]|uniref:hypothetical protein n=1 Tax=Novosphingobium sp. Gsoil 351 TaxID=2675225 RepID=UPI0012B48646|nr:hypothetical protein [Novosphingobium sp. Gsoil 351]QGN54170.1 hypothetical protein GKE62_06040 [Novosphingobium sp. Gsoil 351]